LENPKGSGVNIRLAKGRILVRKKSFWEKGEYRGGGGVKGV